MTAPQPTPRLGDQLASTACTTRVIVVRIGAPGEAAFACGGSPMTAAAGLASPTAPDGAGTLLGKRYVDAAGSVELLCTFAGAGELTCNGEPMAVKAAKPLPASD